MRQRVRHIVAAASDIADLQSRRDLDVYAGGLVRRGVVQEVGPQTAVAGDLIALPILAAAVLRHRGNGVRLRAQVRRSDGKGQGLVFAILRRGEWRGSGL